MSETSTAKLLYKIRRERGLLRILKCERLVDALDATCADIEMRTRIVSELTIRAWLLAGGGSLGDNELKLVHRGWDAYGLPDQASGCLDQWLGEQAGDRRYTLPEEWRLKAEDPLRMRLADDLRDWECADGMVALVATGSDGLIADAICLPYMIDTHEGRHVKEVRTAEDAPLPYLCSGVKQANRAGRAMNLLKDGEHPHVILHSICGLCSIPFEGGSMGLALLVRHWLNNRGVGGYRPLDIGASGCLSANGDLDPDAVDAVAIASKARLFRRIGARHVLLPSCEPRLSGVTHLPCGQPLCPHLAEHLKPQQATKEPAPRTQMSATEIGQALQEIERGMRYGGIGPSEAKARIEQQLAVLWQRTGIRMSRLAVHAHALLASAECHLGNMEAASAICNQILARRAEIGARFTAHTLVLQAVNLTDMAEYARSSEICEQAFAMASELTDPVERLDIEMQALGTQGQALMYWGLLAPRHKNQALRVLDEAQRRARDLDVEDPGSKERDLPRQLNYRFLWHALYEPGHSINAYELALANSGGDQHSVNFLARIRWLAAYRSHLFGQCLEWRDFEHDLPAETPTSGWLLALACKYRGTVRAAAGEMEAARSDFAKAVVPMDWETRSPLLGFFGATAALESGTSLLAFDRKFARTHLERAASLFARRRDWFRPHAEISGEAWLRRAKGLLAGEDPATLPTPQLYYPY